MLPCLIQRDPGLLLMSVLKLISGGFAFSLIGDCCLDYFAVSVGFQGAEAVVQLIIFRPGRLIYLKIETSSFLYF